MSLIIFGIFIFTSAISTMSVVNVDEVFDSKENIERQKKISNKSFPIVIGCAQLIIGILTADIT